MDRVRPIRLPMPEQERRWSRIALDALHVTRGHRLLRPISSHVGAIFRIERVRKGPPRPWEARTAACLSTEQLDAIVTRMQKDGYEVVSLDEAHWRLAEGDFERRFVVFTFDGATRDIYEHAYGVMKTRGVPFTIMVCPDLADGAGEMWWLALEHLIREIDEISLRINGSPRKFPCSTPAAKNETFGALYAWLKAMPESEARGVVRGLLRSLGQDLNEVSGEHALDWETIRWLAEDAAITIGAFGKRQMQLAKLSAADARFEISSSLDRLELELGARPRHAALSSTDEIGRYEAQMLRELGLKTAVTARPSLLRVADAQRLTALPRVPLGLGLNEARHVAVALSGAPIAWTVNGGD